jgi:anthraniloyl-CoA monooxygenase
MQFPRVLCERWYNGNVVLMGDAAATGHYSIGSGSRLAFDSAIALADYLHSEPTMEAAFQRYQDERRVEVLRLQSAARNSLEWFERVERYLDMAPMQFAYSLLTRSQRISHENLRLRDPEWLRKAEDWFQASGRGQAGPSADVRAVPAARHAAGRTASSCRRWRNTRRWTVARPTGISAITPNAPRAVRGWSIPR